MMLYPFDNRLDNTNISKDKHQRIVLVIAMIGAASLLSLGAVASTSITPAFAGGDDDGVKQKAEADNDCDQKNKNEDGDFVSQENLQECIAISANVNELTVASDGGNVPPGPPERITICHVSASGNEITLTLPESAAEAHLEQHDGPPGAGPDREGPC
jgi:hypothetical protein